MRLPQLSFQTSLSSVSRRLLYSYGGGPVRRNHTMTAEATEMENGSGSGSAGVTAEEQQRQQQQQRQRRKSSLSHHPKRLIFAPGDLPSSYPTSPAQPAQPATTPGPAPDTNTATTSQPPPNEANEQEQDEDEEDTTLLSHPSRAHQFLSNPPLHITTLHQTSPLHQFHTWFTDPRLPPSSSPETCTLATASLPSGRVSARVVYLKELDERGWVVYSNWGSRMGKGGQVFGGVEEGEGEGNKWAALTFHWRDVERQVRIEGLVERLESWESETYWRVRERGSQIGGWASYQSKVLWRSTDGVRTEAVGDGDGGDGREVLDRRVEEVRERFRDAEEIPLPPFWGGVRIVPESVEFWQGRKNRLHDRFRYVRVHDGGENGEKKQGEDGDEQFKWVIERLSP